MVSSKSQKIPTKHLYIGKKTYIISYASTRREPMDKYLVLCIFEKVIVYIWYCASNHIWHFMEIFALRQHLEYFNAETQAKNDQIL